MQGLSTVILIPKALRRRHRILNTGGTCSDLCSVTIMWRMDGACGLVKGRQGDKLGGCYDHYQDEMIEGSANMMIRRVDRISLVYLCTPRT